MFVIGPLWFVITVLVVFSIIQSTGGGKGIGVLITVVSIPIGLFLLSGNDGGCSSQNRFDNNATAEQLQYPGAGGITKKGLENYELFLQQKRDEQQKEHAQLELKETLRIKKEHQIATEGINKPKREKIAQELIDCFEDILSSGVSYGKQTRDVQKHIEKIVSGDAYKTKVNESGLYDKEYLGYKELDDETYRFTKKIKNMAKGNDGYVID